MSLNQDQQAAVNVTQHALVTACPGSGKTKVIESRAAHLLATYPQAKLCAVTFSREASEALKVRIAKTCGAAASRVEVGTFHGLCKRQLEKAWKKRLNLISELQYKQIITRLHQEHGELGGTTLDEVLAFVAASKAVVDPPISMGSNQSVEERVYLDYEETLKQLQAKDFSDLVRDAVLGMRSGSIKPLEVDFLLVDEFQDADECQLEWVLSHARAGVQIMVVGDDDQSIFGFRHALGFSGFSRFQSATDAQHISLGITYRCPKEILVPAAQLITLNENRVPKRLQTANRKMGQVYMHAYPDRTYEGYGLIDTICKDGNFGEWLVLSRTNGLLNELEELIDPVVMPYVRIGGLAFWENPQPTIYLTQLRSFADGNLIGLDMLLRQLQLNTSTLDYLHQRCPARQRDSLKRFLECDLSGLCRNDKGFIESLQSRYRIWHDIFTGPPKGYGLGFVGLSTYLNEHLPVKKPKSEKDPEKAAQIHANRVDEQLRRLGQCAARMNQLSGPLRQRVDSATIQGKQRENGVTLMTMHGSKGLEFPKVWLLGCTESVIPSPESPIDEERRLMYVAMTRAQSELHCSFNTQINKTTRIPAVASSFLHESGLMSQA